MGKSCWSCKYCTNEWNETGILDCQKADDMTEEKYNDYFVKNEGENCGFYQSLNAKEKYIVKEAYIELPNYKRNEIEPLISIYGDECAEEIGEYDTLEEAQEILKQYKTKIKRHCQSGNIFYGVSEVYIEKNVYDQDGVLEAWDIVDVTPMEIKLEEKEAPFETLGVFNNYKEAK